MSKKISTLPSGALVKINENGVAKKHIFLGHNHYGQGEVTLLRKDTFGPKAWSSAESYSNTYNVFNGSDYDAFFSEQHIQCLDPIIRACLINVPIPVMRGAVNGTFDSTIERLQRKCFPLSCTEVGLAGSGAEGSLFPYFNSDANRIAYYDETTKAVIWGLRSPRSGYAYIAFCVYLNGTQNSDYVTNAIYFHPRPALALSSEILVSDAPDSSGCYIIESTPAGEQYQKVNGVWLRMC